MNEDENQAPSPDAGRMSPEDETQRRKNLADMRRVRARLLADTLRMSAKAMLFEAQRLLDAADQAETNW